MGHPLLKVAPKRARNRYWASVDGRSRTLSVHKRYGRNFSIRSHSKTHASELATLAFAIITLQILDGLLTGIGMFQFGTHMEGNALLRTLMHHIGYIPALILTKGMAIAAVLGLCSYASRVKWLKGALKGVISVYIILAIIPWTILLAIAAW